MPGDLTPRKRARARVPGLWRVPSPQLGGPPMNRAFFALLWPVVLWPWFGAAIPIAGAARAPQAQTLFFDAEFTHSQTAGPGVTHAGHRQIVTGILRDARGSRVGTFGFICAWTKVERGQATERCVASAVTADGRLDAAGPSQSNSTTHDWRITGGTGRYHDAMGNVGVRDLGERAALVSAALITPDDVRLHAGKVARPAANDRFVVQASGLCQRAAAELATLPPFPFADFDPLHPEPALLPAVGKFFTGPGDPRPAFGALNAGLRALGEPPADHGVWGSVLNARDRELLIIDAQDRAALGGEVRSFVRTVHEIAANFRDIAIATTVFGVAGCAL